jgi:hypothetical protein
MASLSLTLYGGDGELPGEGEPSSRASYLVFQLDNDKFLNSDRDYTNGTRVAFLRPITEDSMNRFQGWLRELSGADPGSFFATLTSFVDPDSIRYDWGTGLTQLMFTPDDPELTYSPPGERPYAGWLGIEFSLHAKDANALSSVTFSIGTTGPNSFAEESQDWVHRYISDSPIYKGWDSQVPGELTLNLNFDQKRRLRMPGQAADNELIIIDGYIEYGASIGNFRTDAFVGTLLRIGYNLPVQYVTPRVQLGSYSHELFLRDANDDRAWSVYAFGGARGSAVAQDITLDGPLFRDYAGAVSSETWVGETVAGFGLRYLDLTITYSHTFRTREFEGQDAPHTFGSIMASVGF